jgi:peptidyl-prolyl cis-trans isomerase B (cyclophilin B)
MARAGDPDSAGCQFFLCLSRAGTARLDNQYCAFGETVEGEETIRAIAAVKLRDPAAGKPVSPPTIKTISLVPNN